MRGWYLVKLSPNPTNECIPPWYLVQNFQSTIMRYTLKTVNNFSKKHGTRLDNITTPFNSNIAAWTSLRPWVQFVQMPYLRVYKRCSLVVQILLWALQQNNSVIQALLPDFVLLFCNLYFLSVFGVLYITSSGRHISKIQDTRERSQFHHY